MTVKATDRDLVERLFKAMQAGPAGEEDMMALFAEDAVFVEPFTGEPLTHTGRDAIRESFRAMWQGPAPDLKLTVERVDLDGANVRADWVCTSPVFPTPMQGHDLFTIQEDRIVRLEIVVTRMPEMGG